LSEGASLHYLADNNYSQKDERGVRWDDPALAIDWKVGKPIVNEKDRLLPLFKDAEYF
jgi:dTDP-4-dehydrorhamnose 3,5-epimerase